MLKPVILIVDDERPYVDLLGELLEKYGLEGGPLHDPCVIAYLLHPELFTGKLVNVTVETGSELTMGMTVADWWGMSSRPRNARWIRGVDADGFFDLLVDRLSRL